MWYKILICGICSLIGFYIGIFTMALMNAAKDEFSPKGTAACASDTAVPDP